jgi:cell division transport system permease protein
MRNQWKFLVREAFRNLGADRFLSVTTVMTLGICGAVLSFLLLGLSLLRAVDEKVSRQAAPLQAYILPAFERDADLRAFERKVEAMNAFDSVVFVSKTEGLRRLRAEFGEYGEEMVRYIDANPLPHSYNLYPSGAPLSAARLKQLREQLLRFKEVEQVQGSFTQLEWLDRWRVPLQTASLLLLLVVATALALIVHNAIKLSLYARRELVDNMKYCGASGFFILAPFALEAVVLGVLGGLIGSLALLGQVRLGALLVPSLPSFVPVVRLGLYLVAGTALIALLSSTRTVFAFLRGKLG